MDHDPVHRPSHYRSRSGRQSIEVTEAWALGPHLTQAVDYILRAGRKTYDPRQDLAKAAWYLRRAADRDPAMLRFPDPALAAVDPPNALYVADDFAVACQHRRQALTMVLTPLVTTAACLRAALAIDRAIAAETARIDDRDMAVAISSLPASAYAAAAGTEA